MFDPSIGEHTQFSVGNTAAKKPEGEFSQHPEAIRMRKRNAKAKIKDTLREEFESTIKSSDFTSQETFLKQCRTAAALFLEADSWLLWTLHTGTAKSLDIPVPTLVTAENIAAVTDFIESFAVEYEQSQYKDLDNHWSPILRLQLLDGLSVPYKMCDCRSSHVPNCPYPDAQIWRHISPGFRDLYRQFCKYKSVQIDHQIDQQIDQTKPAVIPDIPRKKYLGDEIEDRFLSRCSALDLGHSLGVGGLDLDSMSENDLKMFYKKFQTLCGEDQPVAATPAPPASEPIPEPITKVGDIEINSIVRQRGGSAVLKVIGFQEQFARCEFEDSSGAIVSNLLIPVASLEKVSE